MSAQKKPFYTTEEYLAGERSAVTKSEYFAGEIFAMAGASRPHNRITFNLSGLLYNALRGGPCEAYTADMRVKVDRLYTYPDVVVSCDDPTFDDAHVDTLLNPTVLFEVLSQSTEAYDRGAKFRSYRKIPSLREYILIAQYTPHIEVFTRQADGFWLLTQDSEGLESEVFLSSLGIVLPLAEIYERVTFLEIDKESPVNP